MNRITPGSYRQVDEPVIKPIHCQEIGEPIPPGIRQIAAALQVAQSLFPSIKSKNGRGVELHGMHHFDEKQQGSHVGAVIPAGRGLHHMAGDFRHNVGNPCEHRIHVGRIQGKLLCPVNMAGIHHISCFVNVGTFCPQGFQLFQNPLGFFPFLPGGRRQGRYIV